MRTNIVIDDQLMSRALRVSRFKTKKQAVEESLRLLIQLKNQRQIKKARSKLHWKGDLNRMRADR